MWKGTKIALPPRPSRGYGQPLISWITELETHIAKLEELDLEHRTAAISGAEKSEATFRMFESTFPDSAKLQPLRYLIGQTYWIGEETEKARHWFSKVIEVDREENTFYRDLAFRRLQYLEDKELDDQL